MLKMTARWTAFKAYLKKGAFFPALFAYMKKAWVAALAWMKRMWVGFKAFLAKIGAFFPILFRGMKIAYAAALAAMKKVWIAFKLFKKKSLLIAVAALGGAILTGLKGFAANAWKVLKGLFAKIGTALLALGKKVLVLIGPKGWIALAVIALVVLIIRYWDNIRDFFIGLWKKIKNGFKNAWDSVTEIWARVSGWFGNYVITPIGNIFSGLWSRIVYTANNAWQGIVRVFKVAYGWFNHNLIAPVTNAFSVFWDGFRTAAASSWNFVSNVFRTGVNTILGLIQGVVNGVVGAINAALSTAVNALNVLVRAANFIPGVRISYVQAPQLPKINIPMLAGGAVIEPNSPFLAVLGDQRQGKNIEAPLSVIQQAVANVIHDTGGYVELGSGTLQKLGNIFGGQLAEVMGSVVDSLAPGKEINFSIDGRTLARVLADPLHDEHVRVGGF